MDWDELDTGKFEDEGVVLAGLLALAPTGEARAADVRDAIDLVERVRASARRPGLLQDFLQTFSLAEPEGVALMCVAEALLRTSDADARDALIAEKIGGAEWADHLGDADSLAVNASTWALMLTGRLVRPSEAPDVQGVLSRAALRLGRPIMRTALDRAVRILSSQFVMGQTIGEALARARREGLLCSFDMLGEAARTEADARRYAALYAAAIDAVGASTTASAPERAHGVSVKLSALFPRFEAAKEAAVFEHLYPRLKTLALAAAGANVGLTIDAEEADRLVLSLKLVERLSAEPELGAWTGLGLAVQAYQKRAPAVVAAVIDLARRSGRRLMVRLVKGAYWDSEIKRAQIAGAPDYAVFTTKAATDLSYLVCAQALIAAGPAVYPQFATHNAHTLAAIRRMERTAGANVELQRLHGMGEALHAAAQTQFAGAAARVYAPVGSHEDLLPYLVRRLLENGANSSFVHALTDPQVPAEEVAADPVARVAASPGRNPRLPAPPELFGRERRNAAGRDLSQASTRRRLGQLARAVTLPDPARESGPDGLDRSIAAARAAQRGWDEHGGERRAVVLRAMGDALEDEMDRLVALLAREAGKTLADGVSEVREAVDYCRYYAGLAERQFGAPVPLRGPVAELNSLSWRGRGVFACISPWNFPLAIFTGQVAAALAAGNGVVAKPAEQTPRIAARAVEIFRAAALPDGLLALANGPGETVGAALVAHPGIAGVAFTGGTDTAQAINRALAARPGPILPFIAETGGLNGLFVDDTALIEQVTDDALLSAFGSAGQRCSALRVLFAPIASADRLLHMLAGAMELLTIGDPTDPATDIGPLIDRPAREALDRHLERLGREARIVRQLDAPDDPEGRFFGPVLAEIDGPEFLTTEVFGPILHVCRYDPKNLDRVAARFAASGHGLTLGVHSRLDSFSSRVRALVPAGNAYVNRSMIGAVVGVQPFGGEGLSGTGPKAGGPSALTRYGVERSLSVNLAASGGDPALLEL